MNKDKAISIGMGVVTVICSIVLLFLVGLFLDAAYNDEKVQLLVYCVLLVNMFYLTASLAFVTAQRYFDGRY